MTARRIGIEAESCERGLRAARTRMAALRGGLLILLLAAGPVGAQEPAPEDAMCRTDADCKLIYSSCSCVAVSIQDARTFLPANVDCAVNRCRVEHVKAACVNRTCEPASKDPLIDLRSEADRGDLHHRQ